jgi:formamidopyrimidine-DNA glycosylase
MPELPEIETLARRLRTSVTGRRIAEVHLSGKKLRKPVAESFADKLRGRTIRKIRRRGKYLVLELEPEASWVIHLGMSGRILVGPQAKGQAKHTHAVIRFSDSTRLEYRDPRRFGLLAAYDTMKPRQIPELQSLGKDPLSSGFDSAWLRPLLQKSREEIKSFLLDQRRVAGLGNIYACESLFHARIHPARRCFTLTPKEADQLVRAIRKVLRLAIRNRGTSFSDFMDSDGKPGQNQYYLSVFQREGQRCFRCRALIQRIRQGNRSTFCCASCQK